MRTPRVPSSGALPTAPAALTYTAFNNAAGERGAEIFSKSERAPTHTWAAQCFSYQLGLHITPPILEVPRAATIPNRFDMRGDTLRSPGIVFRQTLYTARRLPVSLEQPNVREALRSVQCFTGALS